LIRKPEPRTARQTKCIVVSNHFFLTHWSSSLGHRGRVGLGWRRSCVSWWCFEIRWRLL